MKVKPIALSLFVLFSTAGALAPSLAIGPSANEGLRAAMVVLAACAIFAWFRADARQRDYRPSPFLDVAVFGLAAFALPYYFVRSRGWQRGLVAVASAIGIFLATSLFAGICTVLFVHWR